MSSHADGTAKTPLDAAQKIVIELKGLTSEQQSLALKFVAETLGLPLLHAASAPPISQMHPPALAAPLPPSSADHSTDIRAFTALKAPKSDRQFAAVVAYFYQFEAKPNDRRETIDAETMKEAARLAGRPQVARWAMTLTNAKNAGYLDAAGSGKFKLSSVGENLVAITLPGDGTPAKGKSIGSTKRAKKSPAKKSGKAVSQKKSVRKKG